MKTILLCAVCFAFAGCANTSNGGGGGWVVGNGMTDKESGAEGMRRVGRDRDDDSCACKGEPDCECAPKVKKKKKHATVPQT